VSDNWDRSTQPLVRNVKVSNYGAGYFEGSWQTGTYDDQAAGTMTTHRHRIIFTGSWKEWSGGFTGVIVTPLPG